MMINATSASSVRNFVPTIKEISMLILAMIVIIFVFYINSIMIFKYFAMLTLAVIAFTSRNKLLWITIYFLIIDRVGGFFFETTLEQANTGFPLVTIFPGTSISFKDMLLLALVFNIRTINRFKHIKSEQLMILGLIVSAIFVGGTIYNVNYTIIITYVFRGYFILLLFYIMKADFSMETLTRFLHLISLFLPFVLLDQIYASITGVRFLEQYLKLDLVLTTNSVSMETRATPYGYNIVFFSFLYGLMLLSVYKRNLFKYASNTYGAFLVVLALFSILFSATRGAIGVFAVILLFAAPYLIVRFRNIAITLGIFFLMLNILGAFGLNWDYFFRNTIARLMTTVNPIITGTEITDVGIGGRDVHMTAILEEIRKSPLVGYGMASMFNNTYYSTLGGINTIILFGIPGFLIVTFLMINWFARLYRANRTLLRHTIQYSMGHILFATLMGMLVGYFTSYNYFTSPVRFDVMRLTVIMVMSSFICDYSTNNNRID